MPATVGKVVADGTPTEEWKWLVEGIKEVYAHAEKAGIRIAIEPLNRFETYLINRGDQALALADAVGPNCGVCLDLFHMNIEESDILEAFRKARAASYDVHIADNNRFAPGMGTLDFPAIVETIKGTGYDGALTLEFVATVDRTPASPYGDQVETNPVDVSPEQMKFIIDHGSNLLSDKFYTGLYRAVGQGAAAADLKPGNNAKRPAMLFGNSSTSRCAPPTSTRRCASTPRCWA